MQTATATEAPPTTAPAAPGAGSGAGVTRRRALTESLAPLVVDAVIPMVAYYVLSDGFGMSTLAALAWSSALPAARTVWGLVRDRRLNGLAALILVVNAVGLLLSSVTGDVRLMLAKESVGSAVVGLVVLVSVAVGRPLMTVALRPWVTKGEPAKHAAWDRLARISGRFRRAERTFSVVWGTALLAEAVARVVGVYTLPVDTMVWLGNVILAFALLLAFLVGGATAVDPMEKMVAAEAGGDKG
ncbi:VC0807 family protein [Streptomyces sp. NPDC046261]|uniref:VC0807 family protein n=1 Tax=Streptomyces sp. NPDC046261 TaxID=3157200 RepID=UPI0034117489